MNRRTWAFPAATAVLLGWASAGWGQVAARSFDIDIAGGALLHENASALNPASPLLNLQARYLITEHVGLGFSLDYSRTETDDDIFPLAQFRFTTADSTLYVALTQPVALFHYQVIGTLGTSAGRLYPYLLVGAGGYTLFLDPQANDASIRVSDFAFSFGGALKIRLGEATGLEFGVRDVVYTDYDRDRLNPLPDRTCRLSGDRQFTGTTCPNERFPFLDPERSDPNWSPPESTLHNFVLSAAFSFVPGR